MYNALVELIGFTPQENLYGFIICCCFILFMLDKVWVFLYSIFTR